MWIGSWVSAGFAALGLTLPAYIGAMLVAAAIRNLDDVTGWFKLSHRFIGELGAVALALFLVLALMTLRLWELAGLARPAADDSRRASRARRGRVRCGPSSASWGATTNRP